MDEEILDLGRGALLIPDLDSVDLSNLETLIEAQENAGNIAEIEIETTK